MRATRGIFRWRADAERAAQKLQSNGLHRSRVTVLTGDGGKPVERVPLNGVEDRGACRVLGAVVGAAVGIAGGFELGAVLSAVVPGMGPAAAVGFCGATILGLTGVPVGAAVGAALDKALTDVLPEEELLAHEDALRNGHSVVLAYTDEGDATAIVRHILAEEGAEGIGEPRKRSWFG